MVHARTRGDEGRRRGPRLRARVRDPLRRRRLLREAPEPVVRGADDQADQSHERDVAALLWRIVGRPRQWSRRSRIMFHHDGRLIVIYGVATAADATKNYIGANARVLPRRGDSSFFSHSHSRGESHRFFFSIRNDNEDEEAQTMVDTNKDGDGVLEYDGDRGDAPNQAESRRRRWTRRKALERGGDSSERRVVGPRGADRKQTVKTSRARGARAATTVRADAPTAHGGRPQSPVERRRFSERRDQKPRAWERGPSPSARRGPRCRPGRPPIELRTTPARIAEWGRLSEHGVDRAAPPSAPAPSQPGSNPCGTATVPLNNTLALPAAEARSRGGTRAARGRRGASWYMARSYGHGHRRRSPGVLLGGQGRASGST